jgi:uncharacterized protein
MPQTKPGFALFQHATKASPMTFLTASWRKLLMANYEVSPEILQPYVPHGTELDFWKGKCYVSLVGFMFMDTKILGVSIPFHKDFEEVNLRFYVRRRVGKNGAVGWCSSRKLSPGQPLPG